MSSFEIYLLWVIVPSLAKFFGGITVLLTIVCVFYTIVVAASADDWEEAYTKSHWMRIKRFSVLGIICLLLACLIPGKQGIAVVYLAPKIINNQTIQQIPAEIMKFIDKEIEDKDSK